MSNERDRKLEGRFLEIKKGIRVKEEEKGRAQE